MTYHHKTPTPICPHCGHVMDADEMSYGAQTCDADLFALAPHEEQAIIKCPSCDLEFWVKGGYTPEYTSAFSWEELE